MELTNFPHIKTENDLSFYECYLNSQKKEQTNNESCNHQTLKSYLEGLKGKLIKAELLSGNHVMVKSGKLFEVGQDYICLKSIKNQGIIILKTKEIKCIVVVNY